MLDEDYIERLTGMKARMRLELAGYYGRLNESGKIEAHRRATDVFRFWRSQGKTEKQRDGENNYAALLTALKTMRNEERKPPDKISGDEQLRLRIKRMAKDRKPKSAKMKDILEKRYMTEIGRLREEGLSWRQISSYMKKYHGKMISHTYLKRIFEENAAQKTGSDE